MAFISYAQNLEDVVLFRIFKNIKKGFYIDVGAWDPVIDSVTKAFYMRGWRGINIEPVDIYFEKLLADRPEDNNLKIVAAAETGTLKFYEVDNTGLSTSIAAIAEKHIAIGRRVREREVSAYRLDKICDDNNVTEIHFLKIDVEGAEKQVLEGIDLMRIRPWVILVEATLPNSRISNHEQWEGVIIQQNYRYIYFDGLSRYYVPVEREKDLKPILAIPPNIFDQYVRYSELQKLERIDELNNQLNEANSKLREINKELINV